MNQYFFSASKAGSASALVLLLLLTGCLAIDKTPIEGQQFYERSRSEIVRVAPDLQEAGRYLAGAARVQLTLPDGVPLAGYGARRGVASRGTHDSLYARALILSNGHETVALLTVDLLAITDEIYEAVYRKVSPGLLLTRRNLMISATHTHSGPGGVAKKFWERFAAGPYDPRAFDLLTDQMAGALRLAQSRLFPARVGWGTVEAPEWIRNRMIPGGPVDPEVGFMFVDHLDGSPLAVLINYSAHPTLLKPDNLLLSGDYPGALQAEIERKQGGVALFTVGAVADQTAHSDVGADDFDRVNRMGTTLAERVLAGRRSVLFEESGVLEAVQLSLPLPPPQLRVGARRRLPTFLGEIFFDRESAIHLIRVGPVVLVGVPADLSSALGKEIKAEARRHGLRAVIVGFANDYVGYVLPPRDYFSNAYEAHMSFNGPFMGEYLVHSVKELMATLGQAPSSPQHSVLAPPREVEKEVIGNR
jgi:hypothetical protein